MRVKIGYKAFRALIIAFDRQDVQRLKKIQPIWCHDKPHEKKWTQLKYNACYKYEIILNINILIKISFKNKLIKSDTQSYKARHFPRFTSFI